MDIGSKENPQLIDLATLEYLLWTPKFKGDDQHSKNIVGLEESENGAVISALGLERLCMVANGLERVQDVDYISPFYQRIEQITGGEDYFVGESLRALHRIYADVVQFGLTPRKSRKDKIRTLAKNVAISELKSQDIRGLLKDHSETQPWHDNLEEGIDPTVERIETYRESKHIKR